MSQAMITIKPGDVYTFTRTTHTVGGKSYYRGDKLKVLGPTTDAPHGFSSKRGNFNVSCKHHLTGSVWSSLWFAIEQGWIVKTESL
jgi:hypothetical protein